MNSHSVALSQALQFATTPLSFFTLGGVEAGCLMKVYINYKAHQRRNPFLIEDIKFWRLENRILASIALLIPALSLGIFYSQKRDLLMRQEMLENKIFQRLMAPRDCILRHMKELFYSKGICARPVISHSLPFLQKIAASKGRFAKLDRDFRMIVCDPRYTNATESVFGILGKREQIKMQKCLQEVNVCDPILGCADGFVLS